MGDSRPEPSSHHDDCDQDDATMLMSISTPWPWRYWCRRNPVKSLVIFAVLLVASVLFSALKDRSTDLMNIWILKTDGGKNNILLDEVLQEKYLGGLIAQGFDEKSCLSRHQSLWKHKGPQPHRPSSHLISKLRNYEKLHRRCGPHTKSFKKSLEYLNSSDHGNYDKITDCKYLVWKSRDGLGNRMITLVSAFLYALLTQKVLLVDPGAHISGLFCEPFRGSSWLISSPIINRFMNFGRYSPHTYDYILKWENRSVIPPYAFMYLAHDYTEEDKRFFCDEDQAFIRKVPWLVIQSNVYFVPSLFLMPSFQKELNLLFPEKQTVFHFLGRYLFHPTNSVWNSITTYYNSYLASADEKIGIQIRIFRTNPDPFNELLEQILACVIKENAVLPQINDKMMMKPGGVQSNRTKAVLLTSLDIRYFDAIKKMYEENSTQTGEIIQVFQPSNETKQDSYNHIQNMKALAEMYLLSLTDKLVTSSKSTFGYVAQSLGGMRPWILYRPEEYNATDSKPACQRALSMEPCFQAPPTLECKTRERVDTGKIVGYVRHCEDMSWTWGLKLYDKPDDP
ncbi:OLC1v1012466C1 [Oldenlandia corymbosa var. corymbosa]|uniref:Fucosyltransferase n=1 Tax=Oldenlandia corymbosa var. corymbosa TaxID=529605 RepID=A0AAV1DW25_OLDCO|nr:OLC1v1012466C1 [Oldenlandia corymbosa var. corymbosa]